MLPLPPLLVFLHRLAVPIVMYAFEQEVESDGRGGDSRQSGAPAATADGVGQGAAGGAGGRPAGGGLARGSAPAAVGRVDGGAGGSEDTGLGAAGGGVLGRESAAAEELTGLQACRAASKFRGIEVFSLMSSLLKYATKMISLGEPWNGLLLVMDVSKVSLPMARAVAEKTAAAIGSSPEDGSPPAAGAATAGNTSSSSSTAAAAVPWAVLVSRCLIVTGKALEGPCKAPNAFVHADGAPPGGLLDHLHVLCDAVEWLSSSLTQLSSASRTKSGPKGSTQAMDCVSLGETIAVGLKRAAERCSDSMVPLSGAGLAQEARRAVGLQLAQQMGEFGVAVAAQLPLLYCCNNPGCGNLGGFSEVQLVKGTSSRCSGCRAARYCGRSCQVAHWKEHKGMCKKVKEEGGAGAADC